MKWFPKQTKLKPSTMSVVAERRFADATALAATNQNARANGVVYLAGIVVEILLKARLVAEFPSVAGKHQSEMASMNKQDQRTWNLIWRSHDLEDMINRLSHLENALKYKGERDGTDYMAQLKSVCAVWTIQARYSSHTMIKMKEARAFVDRVRQLKELLK